MVWHSTLVSKLAYDRNLIVMDWFSGCCFTNNEDGTRGYFLWDDNQGRLVLGRIQYWIVFFLCANCLDCRKETENTQLRTQCYALLTADTSQLAICDRVETSYSPHRPLILSILNMTLRPFLSPLSKNLIFSDLVNLTDYDIITSYRQTINV